jgi:hypothetical protein
VKENIEKKKDAGALLMKENRKKNKNQPGYIFHRVLDYQVIGYSLGVRFSLDLPWCVA